MGERVSAPLNSPCIGQCELGPDEVCRGCFRTLEEIATWSDLTPIMRDEVRARIARDHPAEDSLSR